MPQRPRSLDPEASALAKFGARLRARRMERGWAQAELGRLVHVSGTLIAKMERAERRPQPDVAHSLDLALRTDGELARLAADALRCHVVSMQLEPDPRSWHSSRGLGDGWVTGVNELRRMADQYDLPEDGGVRSRAELKAAVTALIRSRLNSDYATLIRTIPTLIPELTRALLTSSGTEREEMAACLVQAWRAADAVAAKLGLFDLSARLILVMGWAAAQSGGPLPMAATSYVRAETFFVSGQQQAGHLMLQRAAAGIDDVGSSVPAAAQYGALHMRAAIAAARAGLQTEADDHLSEAWSMAELVERERSDQDRSDDEEGVWQGTAFGPASVRIHEVSTAVELNAPQRALSAAHGWVPPLSLPAERRSHFFVDLARAQLAVGEHDSVLRSLEQARQIAPQNVQVDLYVRETLAALAGTSAANASAVDSFARTVALTGAAGTNQQAGHDDGPAAVAGPSLRSLPAREGPAIPRASPPPSPPYS